MYTCCTSKKKRIDLMIQNPDLLRLRLSPQEKYYYTNLFYEHSTNEKVTRNKFPALLGLLGTDIAESFAIRIFDTFSSDKKSIRLNEYLKYVDVYHYGDEIERCRVTFQLMDTTRDGEIDLKEFEEYINLLIAAIRKVHPGMSDNLFSSKDTKDLFKKIVNNNKSTFSYSDFEKVYLEKPDLLSWIDYFKNNDEEVLYLINNNLRSLLLTLQTFLERFSKIMNENSKENIFEMNPAIKEIDKFCKSIDKRRKVFINSANRFSIRTIFENLTNSFNETKIKREKSPTDDKGKLYGSNTKLKFDFENIPEFKANTMTILEKNKHINIDKDEDEEIYSHLNPNEEVENNQTYLPMFLTEFNHRLINDQFKNIRHNINENFDSKNIKSIIYEENNEDNGTFNENTKRQPNEIQNFKGSSETKGKFKFNNRRNIRDFKLQNKYKRNTNVYIDKSPEIEGEISKIYETGNDLKGYVKSEDFSKNEVILFDDSRIAEDKLNRAKNGVIQNEKESLEKFNSVTKLSGDDSLNNLNLQIFTTNDKSKMEIKQNKFLINLKTKKLNSEEKDLGLNIGEETKKFYNQPNIKEGKNDFNLFFSKMKILCDTSCQMVKWIEQSYKWVENRYLKEHLKKNKYFVQGPGAKPNYQSTDLRFSIQNIPKVKKEVKKSKKKNLLKATDDNFKILLNVVMGIQLAVQSTPCVKVDSTADLTNYLHSLTYSIQTTNFGSKRQETFYIKEYAGILFNNIRNLYDVNKDTFISSISPQDFITGIIISGSTIIEELCSTGKSGSLFYYTRDGKYILKTISPTEYNFLKKILPNYFRHLMNNKNTLLPKFFGCYKLVKKIKKSKSRVYFVIMQNIFSTNKEIHLRYDLKGSKIGRQVLTENHKLQGKLSYALKDLDLEKNKQAFFVGDKKSMIMSAINSDTQFLADNNIIDYSLLIGIHILDIDPYAHTIKERLPKMSSIALKAEDKKLTGNVNCENFKEFHSLKDKNSVNYVESHSDYSMYNKDVNITDNNESENEIRMTESMNRYPFIDSEDGGIKSENNKEVYFMGIIDILTEYNCVKRIEYLSKLLYYCSGKMSCIPPVPYKERFYEYMKDKFVDVDLNKKDYKLKDQIGDKYHF